jgi:hypothetical protein
MNTLVRSSFGLDLAEESCNFTSSNYNLPVILDISHATKDEQSLAFEKDPIAHIASSPFLLIVLSKAPTHAIISLPFLSFDPREIEEAFLHLARCNNLIRIITLF